jgi:hypothetical protein
MGTPTRGDGLVWLSMPAYTVGLVVRGHTVVDCPPIARRWAYRKDWRAVWNDAAKRGARLQWIDC